MNEAHSLAADELRALDMYWRAANYLGVAQIYLRDNCLLEEPLEAAHIKPRLLGHWGTVPGINFIYAHLNRLVRQGEQSVLLVTGPGHGAPANLANLYLEGTLAEFYPELTQTKDGITRLVSQFSMPGGFPSHLSPATPGCIHEGGELGYALATAFGAAFDSPDLIVACIVGDGEAETGPTATAWHSTKYLNPARDGAVLPILHLNGYKISSRTIFGAMSDEELNDLFRGYGYDVHIVNAQGETVDERGGAHRAMAEAMDAAYESIRRIGREAQRGGQGAERPRFPMLILRSPKGWTCPAEIDGKPLEGSYRAHQVPIEKPQADAERLALLAAWLDSYRPREIFDGDGRLRPELTAMCPKGRLRIGMNANAIGGSVRRELRLPDFREHAIQVTDHGAIRSSDTTRLGEYLRDVVRQNETNFRIVCPDEMESNKLGAIFEATNRQFACSTDPQDDHIGREGRVLEILSEHTCQGWLQGYLLTGRHGLFPCYEAFAPIVDSMMNQYAKFLKLSAEVAWREPISSFTYLLSSEGWRQDHNGYSHQGPGFINNLLTKKSRHVRIYLPPDTNCLLSTIDHCLTSTDKINLVIASKQPMPQWLSMDDAIEHCRRGASVWRWASTDEGSEPDVVLAASGVYPTNEVMAAAALLREELPDLRVRVINVTDLLILEPDSFHPHGLTEEAFNELFTADKLVIFNFHGYPSAVKQLLFERPSLSRFQINGYIEEGTTTTPFDLFVQNRASRYQVVIQAVRAASRYNRQVAAQSDAIVSRYEQKLTKHHAYIRAHGEDMPEIADWKWA
ncbi:MAG: phosphoketolase family protein [Acidobacteria bacterium]|nr:phosphoketolase family protein [Acidobacteriota bacterium]